jgi:HAD superfamily hydrolase (TIGR01549 family)
MPQLMLGDRRVEGELIIFDKDGVLVDFHHLWAAVTRARAAALCAAARMPELESELIGLLGLEPDGRVTPTGLLACGSRHDSTLVAAARLHQAGLPWNEARATAFAAFEAAEGAIAFEALCRPLPGVKETLKALAAVGWKLAIATTDQTEGARRFLVQEGLDDLFVAVVGVDQVKSSKPAPEMVHLACDLAGVAPSRAVMVGDVDLDLRMGRAAGVAATVGVLSGVGDATLLAPHADSLLPDVASLFTLSLT